MARLSILVLFLSAILAGMRFVYTIDVCSGNERSFHRAWFRKETYAAGVIWLAAELVLWSASGRNLYPVRLADLAGTYILLAIADIRKRIVPDSVLLCFFAAQLLLAALSVQPEEIVSVMISGAVFAAAATVFALAAKGKIGLGDVKLMGTTAMTAGWSYMAEIFAMALFLSFFFSAGLLLLRKATTKTEIPFVPFLAAAVSVHTFLSI